MYVCIFLQVERAWHSFWTSLDLNLRIRILGCVKLGKLSGSWNLSFGFVLIYKERKYRHRVHIVHNPKDEMTDSHSKVLFPFMSSIHPSTSFLPPHCSSTLSFTIACHFSLMWQSLKDLLPENKTLSHFPLSSQLNYTSQPRWELGADMEGMQR